MAFQYCLWSDTSMMIISSNIRFLSKKICGCYVCVFCTSCQFCSNWGSLLTVFSFCFVIFLNYCFFCFSFIFCWQWICSCGVVIIYTRNVFLCTKTMALWTFNSNFRPFLHNIVPIHHMLIITLILITYVCYKWIYFTSVRPLRVQLLSVRCLLCALLTYINVLMLVLA